MGPIDLSIIIVSWNVRELLRACLASIAAGGLVKDEGGRMKDEKGRTEDGKEAQGSRGDETRTTEYGIQNTHQIEVIVVDSGSSDGSPAMLQKEFPWVRLETYETNVGYTRANNRGIALATGRYILLLNPDTEIVSSALTTMLHYMDEHPTVGALGPQLLEADGRVQSSRRRFPTRRTALVESTIWQPLFTNSSLLRHYYCLDRPDDQAQAVDWVTGAALLVRRSVIEQVGGFDEGFFMYSEELDLCRRIKAAGWEIHYFPTAQIVHHGGKSSDQAIASRHIHFQTSKIRYFTKYHGRWFGECLRLYLLATYVYQIAEEGIKWLLGHKRPLRAGRLAVYWQVLRSGLRRDH